MNPLSRLFTKLGLIRVPQSNHTIQVETSEICESLLEEGLLLAAAGFIKGFDETNKEFLSRIVASLTPLGCRSLEVIRKAANGTVGTVAPSVRREGVRRVQGLFGCAPWWPTVLVLQRRFPSFTGAATWWVTTMPLRPFPFPFIWIYRMKPRVRVVTMVAHELVHCILPQGMSEMQEEYFAYQTSSRTVERWLGPLLGSRVGQLVMGVALTFWVTLSLLFSFSFAAPVFVAFLALGFQGMTKLSEGSEGWPPMGRLLLQGKQLEKMREPKRN